MMITVTALIKSCFWHCSFWQDFLKVHSRGLYVYKRGWSMSVNLFTLSSSVLVLSFYVFLLTLGLQIKISLRDFSPSKSTNFQMYKYCEREKKPMSYLTVLLYWNSKTENFFIVLGIFNFLFWMQIKVTQQFSWLYIQ
jgi:hypothetical protein